MPGGGTRCLPPGAEAQLPAPERDCARSLQRLKQEQRLQLSARHGHQCLRRREQYHNAAAAAALQALVPAVRRSHVREGSRPRERQAER